MSKTLLAATALVTCVSFAVPATAQSAGDWTLGFGIGYVMPKDDNGNLTANDVAVDVGDNARPIFTAEYFVMDNVGIELLAAVPFQHNVDLDGLGKVAEATHLPPTLSIQYHFQTGTPWVPFAGVGVNYTTFLDVETEGALDGLDLDLEDSWGVAVHAGVDYKFDDRNAVRADIYWADIDADAKLEGDDIGTVEIDPFIFGISYVRSF